jgi:hypothetical protein
MSKSKVRKKKGKPVKYTPKPTGISKTKMKKLMELIAQQQESMKEASETPEIREGEGSLHISENFTKKLNVVASDSINEGPELQETENSHEEFIESLDSLSSESIDTEIYDDSSDVTEGPVSSENE